MTADWTTCRVVRDHDGDLWSRIECRYLDPESEG